ncbi:hypothetical protein NIES4102_22370 [Chondrocystis sp. NIES-4102]|nr:hypothetical protein NIES4102_22370 [Chondrocystis sp. NIES-4102]
MSLFAENFASLPKNFSSPDPDSDAINNLLNLILTSEFEEETEKTISEEATIAESEEVQDDNSTNQVDNDQKPKVEVVNHEKAPIVPEKLESETFLFEGTIPMEETISKFENLQTSLDTSVNQSNNPTDAEAYADNLELIELVNTLIPLLVELVQCKITDSQEAIIQALNPQISQLIEQHFVKDAPKMAKAIAPILPSAITEKINLDPEAIAKAIAPEIALAIKEQIRLDEDAIATTLGPQMGKSIKTQIQLERDAMVDALYPVIGSTISKYMVEVVQDINSKVENALSFEGVQRKIKAKMQGVSEAELIFHESVGYQVLAVFLINKDSGVVIQEVQKDEEKHLNSDLIAGMLTAIRSFANDCIASGSELDAIDYGDWQIPIEVAGYCYLAVVVRGEPSKKFRTKIRDVLGDIVLKHGQIIQDYEGNMATVPLEIKFMLEELIGVETNKPHKSASPATLLWLLAFILSMILVPWGLVNHRARLAQQVESTVTTQLDAAPELSVYRLEPFVRKGILTVKGRVPSQDLQQQATTIIQAIATKNNLKLDNQILAVNVPTDPKMTRAEIQRLTRLFNQQSDTLIDTDYQASVVTVRGFILNPTQQQTISKALQQIPEVKQIIWQTSDRLPSIDQQIIFPLNNTKVDLKANQHKIKLISQFLKQYPQLNLKLVANWDRQGSLSINQKLAEERCNGVKTALVNQGVDARRLTHDCANDVVNNTQQSLPTPTGLSNITLGQNDTPLIEAQRYVKFEPFIPKNQFN